MAGARSITYLAQAAAKQVDVELMGSEIGFTLEQLMEMAGMSVAHAVYRSFPPAVEPRSQVLAVCGQAC